MNQISQFNTQSNKSNKPDNCDTKTGVNNNNNNNTPRTKIINLSHRTDRKERITALFNRHKIKDYDFVEAVDGTKLNLTYDIYSLFKNNDFGNRRCFIGCALSHYQLWQQLVSSNEYPYYIIYEDDVQIEPEFTDRLERLQRDIVATTDILFLGSSTRINDNGLKRETTSSGFSAPLNKDKYIGGFFGYIITRQGANKMLEYISKNGIRHGIDYLVKVVPNLECITAQPHIVFSEAVYKGSQNQDSNIQLDTSSFNFNTVVDLNAWEFHKGVDMLGNDIRFVGRHAVSDIAARAFFMPECVAFNTLGFLKSATTTLTTSIYFSEEDGVYVRRCSQIQGGLLLGMP